MNQAEFHIRTEHDSVLALQQARREALLSFGGVEKHKEESRDATGAPMIETLLQDVRYGFRGLKRNPVFAAAAVALVPDALGKLTAAGLFHSVRSLNNGNCSSMLSDQAWPRSFATASSRHSTRRAPAAPCGSPARWPSR